MHLKVSEAVIELGSTLPLVSTNKENELASGFTSQIQNVKKGDIFIAHQGLRVDGHSFFREAIERGARHLIGQRPALQMPGYVRGIYTQVDDSRLVEAYFSGIYFENPSHSMRLFGVTGTSGKTTNTYLLRSCLEAAGKRVGLIGTVEISVLGQTWPAEYTTPNAFELNHILHRMREAGCTDVVMEVSSHALKQRRTAFLEFDGVWFTNLSPEHLDYHPTMEDYYESKRLLFTDYLDYTVAQGKPGFAAINITGAYGVTLFESLKQESKWNQRTFAFALTSSSAFRSDSKFFSGKSLNIGLEGVAGKVEGPIPFQIDSVLVGAFNAENLMGAGVVAAVSGVDSETVSQGLKSLQHVPGRLDRVDLAARESGTQKGSVEPYIYVDYAHKPDALEKVLITLRGLNPNRLITVFGCGGDRDPIKRPVMGAIAERLSDWVVVTSDNPRTEDPLKIIESILSGTSKNDQKIAVEPDRKKAIEMAVKALRSGDVLLVAGKGHENYQIIRDSAQPSGVKKIPFDDKAVALQAWQELR